MFKHFFYLPGLLLLALSPVQAAVSNDTGRFVLASDQEESLAKPYFTSQAFPILEKEIILSYLNPNQSSETEVYISRSPDGGFVLAAVLPPGEHVYYDTSRLPRTTYYFKLRAVEGELISDFSGIKSFTTGSKFYHPILTAEATGSGTIELKFYDRSYNDLSYQIFREGPGPDFHHTIVAIDSGRVFEITDDFLEPNTTYNYRVDAYTQGPNMPRYIGIVNIDVTTPQGPEIFTFIMIDADTDLEETDLYDGIELIPPDRLNIKAEASEGTQSVVFFLNGQRRVENEPPYAYFYDVKGDYSAGKLAPGDYKLLATPYTGNNGSGSTGASLQINFRILFRGEDLTIESFTLVDPNSGLDIKELKDGDVVDISGKPNIRANTGVKTSSVVFSLNGISRTENEVPYAYFTDVGGVYRPGTLKEGQTYTLEATPYSGNNGTGAKGLTTKIQFSTQRSAKIQNLQGEPISGKKTHYKTVEQNTQNFTGEEMAMSVFPVPAEHELNIKINGKEEDNALVIIKDVQGHTVYTSLSSIEETNRNTISTTGLKPGVYFVHLRTDKRTPFNIIKFIKK